MHSDIVRGRVALRRPGAVATLAPAPARDRRHVIAVPGHHVPGRVEAARVHEHHLVERRRRALLIFLWPRTRSSCGWSARTSAERGYHGGAGTGCWQELQFREKGSTGAGLERHEVLFDGERDLLGAGLDAGFHAWCRSATRWSANTATGASAFAPSWRRHEGSSRPRRRRSGDTQPTSVTSTYAPKPSSPARSGPSDPRARPAPRRRRTRTRRPARTPTGQRCRPRTPAAVCSCTARHAGTYRGIRQHSQCHATQPRLWCRCPFAPLGP